MAGVPLLNGFLVEGDVLRRDGVSSRPRPGSLCSSAADRHAGRHLQRGLLGASCSTCSSARPAATSALQARRTSRRTGCGVPVEVLVPICTGGGRGAGLVGRLVLAAAARAVVGGILPEYSLAVWHGFNLPLLMRLRRHGGRRGPSTRAAPPARAGGLEHTPLLHRFDGQCDLRAPDGAAERGRPSAAAACSARARMQTQLLLLVGSWPWPALRRAQADARGHRHARAAACSRRCFAMTWLIGGVRALAAAWQAKFHRLAALMPARGRGPRSCVQSPTSGSRRPTSRSRSWWSRPSTTVLILLGLRWLPMRSEVRGADRERARCAPWGRAPRPAGGHRRRLRHGGAGLGHDDAHLPRRASRPSSSSAHSARAAAPTWST